MYKRFSIIMLAVALSSCGTPQQKASALEENKEAKSLLEGIWLDDNTETGITEGERRHPVLCRCRYSSRCF